MKLKSILAVIVLVITGVGFYYFLFSNEAKIRGFESASLKVVKEFIVVTQDSYKDEFKEYNLNASDLIRNLKIDGVKVFFNKDEVPQDIIQKTGDNLPFLEKERYSILIVIDRQDLNYHSIWKLGHDGNLVKLHSGR